MAVLACDKTRASSFNIYLAVLLSIDVFRGLNFFITCMLNVTNGGYLGRAMCDYQGNDGGPGCLHASRSRDPILTQQSTPERPFSACDQASTR